MTRGLSAGNKAAVGTGRVSAVYFIALDFPDGMALINSTSRNWRITLAPDLVDADYLGKGRLAAIQFGDENTEGRVTRARISLSGVQQEHVQQVLDQKYRNRPGRIWRGFVDESWLLTATPELHLSGLMQPGPMKLGEVNTVSVELVSRLSSWEKATDAAIWDDRDHQALRPGDLYHEFAAEIAAGKDVPWGRPT